MFKTELEAFLNQKSTADFISVAVEKTAEEYKKLSDFEKFALVCDNLDSLLGSDILKRFLNLICPLNSEKITPNLLKSKREQNKVWREIHGAEILHFASSTEPQNTCVDYYRFSNVEECFDIIEYISKHDQILPQSLEEFLENNYITSKTTFVIDLSKFEYTRPNEYLSNAVYKKISCGEKYKKNELSALALHILCNVGKSKKIRLKLILNGDVSVVFLLSDLFEKRSADVEICLCFNLFSCDMFEYIFEAMLQIGRKISSEIIIPEEVDVNNIHKSISELLNRIPFSRIAWQKDYAPYIDELFGS